MKDKVSREVAKMFKDLEFTVRADGWGKKVFSKVIGGDVGYCLKDDVEVGASGNHHPSTFPKILLPTMSLSTLATSLVTYSSSLKTL